MKITPSCKKIQKENLQGTHKNHQQNGLQHTWPKFRINFCHIHRLRRMYNFFAHLFSLILPNFAKTLKQKSSRQEEISFLHLNEVSLHISETRLVQLVGLKSAQIMYIVLHIFCEQNINYFKRVCIFGLHHSWQTIKQSGKEN